MTRPTTGPDAYLVPARDAEVETEVRRSRFRCVVRRVESEEAARAVVESARREHWDARHHCSAFVLGADAATQRSNDDGEPAGTAGAPMLEAIRGEGVSDVVAIVTRWFGGVLLGTGGLVRAYGDAVRAGLEAAGTVARERHQEFLLAVPHPVAGRLESDLRARGVAVLGVEYAEVARMRVGVPARESVAFPDLVADLTAGGVRPEPAGERWVDRQWK